MNYDSELYCIGRGLPPDEGGLHQALSEAYKGLGEDYPQMKGDYTVNREVSTSAAGEDYPQMKGDYTLAFHNTLPDLGEDYPQMKGDYTVGYPRPFSLEERITPR